MALPSWSVGLKIFNYVQRARPNLIYLCANERGKQCFVQRLWIAPCRVFSSDANAENSAMGIGPGLNEKPKKKKVFIPKVTLLSEDNEMSIVTMEMAERIANRRGLKLVKIVDFDTKTERPTYKLMTTRDYIQEGEQRKKVRKFDKETALKPEKMLSISSKIGEHDLITKLKSVAKLLAKKHEIRILIAADGNKEKAVEIGKQIETAAKELPAIVKTSLSGGNVKIYLRPRLDSEVSEKKSELKDKKESPESPVNTTA